VTCMAATRPVVCRNHPHMCCIRYGKRVRLTKERNPRLRPDGHTGPCADGCAVQPLASHASAYSWDADINNCQSTMVWICSLTTLIAAHKVNPNLCCSASYTGLSCLIPVFTVACMSNLSPNNNIGTRMNAGCIVIGTGWVAVGAAGGLVRQTVGGAGG
jgi:hypothetical protein